MLSGSFFGALVLEVIKCLCYLITSIQNTQLTPHLMTRPQCSAESIHDLAQKTFNVSNLQVTTVRQDGTKKTFKIVSGDFPHPAYLVDVNASSCEVLLIEELNATEGL